MLNKLPRRKSLCLVGDKIDDSDETALYYFFDKLFKVDQYATYSLYKSVGELTDNGIPSSIEFIGVYSLHKAESAIQKRLVFDHLIDEDRF